MRVYPKQTTLHTTEEAEAYVTALKAEILVHLDAGHPVIL